MTTELPPVRRIVTGNDAQGKSYIAEDGVSPAMLTMPGRTGFRNNNLWRTVGSPADVHAADSVLDHRGVMPPPGGTVLRVIDIPPESGDAEERARATAATFKQLYPDAIHQPDGRHPGMHVTRTVDYAIVLQGELYAVMDQDEVLMKAGDVLIQRGTNHAWSNRSGAIARIAFILIDGRR
jgi:mannose-6-phosphate isomerase-like protein (cupin superfamily)